MQTILRRTVSTDKSGSRDIVKINKSFYQVETKDRISTDAEFSKRSQQQVTIKQRNKLHDEEKRKEDKIEETTTAQRGAE